MIRDKVVANNDQVQSFAKDRLVEEDYQIFYDQMNPESKPTTALYNGIIRQTKQKVQIRICEQKSPDISNYLYEVSVLKKLDHPNILKVLDIFEDENYYIYVQNSTEESQEIQKVLLKDRNEAHAKGLFLTFLGALEHMHSRKVFHSHLENFQLDYKICDFWKEPEMNKTYVYTSPVASINHESPSIHTRFVGPELRRHTVYDYRVDYWSLGFFLYKYLEDPNAVASRLRFRDVESYKLVTRGVSELSNDHWLKF